MRALRFVLPAVVAALGVAPSAQAAAGGIVEEVASGLDSPRHLEFGSSGNLFVAEAGRGGSDFCFTGGEGPACMGATGAVTKIDRKGRQSRIATGLASYANDPGNENAIGPHGIAVLPLDIVLVTNGGPTAPRVNNVPIGREGLVAQKRYADRFGRVLAIRPPLPPVSLADTWAFERDHNPDGGAVDANPVDVEVDGLRLIVPDAGGNALNAFTFGHGSNLAVFPIRPNVPSPFGGTADMQAVPTSVEIGPDRHYYVSQLTGFPFPIGGAKIYRVSPRGGEPKVAYSGFTAIMDLAFAKDGTLYVLEIDHDGLFVHGPSTEGAIWAIPRHGGKPRRITLPDGTLPFPGGITVGKDGLYVTINSGSPGGGMVVRIKAR
jgi:hypothetical protein